MNLRRTVWITLGALSTLSAADAVLAAGTAPMATAVVEASGGGTARDFDAVVEATRQATLSPRIPATVTEIRIRPGDHVKAGQVLVKLDARAAAQSADAGQAQAEAAQAAADVARRDFDRQQHLFDKGYISQSAFERAQARFHESEAQWHAGQAQAGAARTTANYDTVVAPFSGVVASVPANVGDLVAPGSALLVMYDPSGLRVTAHVPEAQMASWSQPGNSGAKADVEVTLAGVTTHLTPRHVQVLPAADSATHTIEIRLDIPANAGLIPGGFARVWMQGAKLATTADAHLFVPAASVMTRTEMSGVYVVDDAGHALLRQVRIGGTQAGKTEILSGLSAGERVALDPQAAAIAH